MTCVSSARFSICVNGEAHGYFKGGRGLRQGDPMSPYLFTLVMEVLSLILSQKILRNKEFKYHFGCKKLKISHLYFVDDLMVLCHGDLAYVKVNKEALDDFSRVSGLHPNLGKSTVFFGNVDEEVKGNILQLLPFTIGKLPMKYLGVPLLAKRLGVSDCRCLIDKIYWASVYMLPNSVNNSWIWPDEWKIKYPSLFSINVHVLQDNEDDVCRLSNDGSISRYQTSKAWVNLRENKPKVSWYHVIWFKQATPKHDFVLWLVIQNRLVTQDKLQKWYPNLQLKCVLCDLEVDSHKHLFYSCAYSSAIWGMVNRKLLFKGLPNDLQRIMVMLSGYPYSKNIWNVINRIVIAAVVYYVWQERNYRIFKGRKRSELELKGIIEQFVRFKLLTLKVKGSQAVEKAAKMWELSWVNLKFQVSNGQSLL
ncbi:uncharacterized protein [Rutidosis leptorrhynchoides]|uniref:uncharacterized protein n=1 Tax=Rutidosis leptorrhynchoides TaxID=125765 RepID=UPI003A9926A9